MLGTFDSGLTFPSFTAAPTFGASGAAQTQNFKGQMSDIRIFYQELYAKQVDNLVDLGRSVANFTPVAADDSG